MNAGSFRDLIAWQKAIDLAVRVYELTSHFPGDERFGLVSQLRRCAVSIPSNIAEGHGRLTTKDWQHFLSQARGSGLEMQTQLILAERLKFAEERAIGETLAAAEEVCRILNGLLASTADRLERKPFH
jgi:four helix bundle protein